MKGLKTLVGAAALLAAVAPVSAADLLSGGGSGSLKDPSGNSQICGFYLEAMAGPAVSQSDASVAHIGSGTLSEDGGIAVVRGGYDKCGIFGNRFGVGVYVEGSDNFDVNGNLKNNWGKVISFGQQYSYGAGGKLFYDHGLGQIYGLVGWAETQQNLGGGVKTEDGYLLGAGISLKITDKFYGKIEYDQIRYGDLSQIVTSISHSTPVKWDGIDNRVLFGVGFSLGN